MLKLVNVSKRFIGGEVITTALNGVTLEIDAGEYVAVMGPSGCGKSTLLTVLGMLDSPDSGEYWFEGRNVAGFGEGQLNDLRRGRVSFIFQGFNLIEDLTVDENVALALEYSGLSAAESRERVAKILEELAMRHRARHYPSQLSGGQQQRVAIARALVTRPAVLLADEPTGNLDSAHGEEVMQLLQTINADGTTIIMVTHSAIHAARAARTVHMLDGVLGTPSAAL